MNGIVEKVPLLLKCNRLRHQIYDNGRGGFAYPPYGTVLQNRNRFAPSNHANHLPRTRTTPPALRHRVMVTVNQMDEWIGGADATR